MLRILDKDGKPKFVWRDEDTEPQPIQDKVKQEQDKKDETEEEVEESDDSR